MSELCAPFLLRVFRTSHLAPWAALTSSLLLLLACGDGGHSGDETPEATTPATEATSATSATAAVATPEATGDASEELEGEAGDDDVDFEGEGEAGEGEAGPGEAGEELGSEGEGGTGLGSTSTAPEPIGSLIADDDDDESDDDDS